MLREAQSTPSPDQSPPSADFNNTGASAHATPGRFPRDFGPYDLLEQIGQGGMGIVYRARHRALGRMVALKLLIAGEFSSPGFVNRFRREAASAASLRHPGIVAVYEAGEVANQPFLAMELVEGRSLAERVRENPLAPRIAAGLLRAIADAVHHAHTHGVLHRDIKPANILLDIDDQPRVTDFGLAKRLDGSTDLTVTGQMLGSPHYLSPEAALGGKTESLTPASDVYSLGATLYHVLTGRPPLLADSVAETLARVRDQAPVAPRLLNPAIPTDIETICLRCLEKKPEQRYASALAFGEDLARWERGEPILARPATPLERAVKWTRRHPARAALIGVLILSGLILTGGSLWFNVRLTNARNEANDQRLRAEANQSASEASEAASRSRLIRMQVATANRQVADGDPMAAALWSSTALIEERGGPGEPAHRRRLAAQWAQGPKLVSLNQNPHSPPFASSNHPTSPSPFRLATRSDGNTVVYRADGTTVMFYNAGSGTDGELELCHFLPNTSKVRTVTLVPTDRHVHVHDQLGQHHTWDLITGKLVSQPVALEQQEGHPSFRPDGTAWTRFFNRSNRWFLELRPIVADALPTLQVPLDSHPFSMKFDPAGRWLMTAHWDGMVHLWSPDNLKHLATPVRAPSGFSCAAISPDGSKLATGGWNQEARVWSLPEGRPLTPPLRLSRFVEEVQFSPDARYLAVRGGEGLTRIWDLHMARQPALPHSAGVARTQIWNVQSNGRGVVAAWDAANQVHFWTLPSDGSEEFRHQKAEMPEPEDRSPFSQITVSRNGQRTAISRQNGRVVLWDVSTGRIRHQLQHGAGADVFLTFSPDGRWLASAGSDGMLRCWDVTTGQLPFPAFHQGSPLGKPAFSPDSRFVLLPAKDGKIRIWDRQTGAPLDPILSHDHWALAGDFSPDGTHVVTAMSDHSADALHAQIWEVTSGRRIGMPIQHSDGVSMVRYFPDGKRILTAGEDGQARVWNAADGSPNTPWMRCGPRIFRAEISTDGMVVITVDEGNRLRLWDVQNGELLSANPLHQPVAHATFLEGDRVVYSDLSSGSLHWLAMPLAKGSPADLAALARLSAGFEIDTTGGLAPLSVEKLTQLYDQLRTSLPNHFRIQLFEGEWHRQERARAIAAQEPFAIEFHTKALGLK